MSDSNSLFTPQELREWQLALAEADRYNIFCHCRKCDREWVASTQVPCTCGSTNIEYIACWQFPDD
ncbi:hypothetical protein H6G89_17590 [Oscillatoria sp. FACHB-1407]|uniref:hypothetical protein n=1 Tax=Oscillatoria sp. FACHB-1407 TaxID=2692847 RepID=UPI001681F6A1|nr:hypothetical protein [Oscillatoria sp. FACHB-1407]MBD2462856.1 hypothetical protein [Oscillatoria sp. FACHB-1407]